MSNKKPIEVLTITVNREVAKDLYNMLGCKLRYALYKGKGDAFSNNGTIEIIVGTAEEGVKCRWDIIEKFHGTDVPQKEM